MIYSPVTCYVPSNFTFDKIKHYNSRWSEKYIYLVHTILFRSLREKTNFNNYVNLDARLLKYYLGDRYYKNIINQLVNSGIIEVNRSYSQGMFCKSYRLTSKYINDVSITTYEIKKKSYYRKINISRSEYMRDVLKDNPYLQHEFQKLTYRRIRYQDALKYIVKTYKPNSPQFNSRILALKEFDEMHKASFSDGNYSINFHFSYNKGRVYSPASMLPRDLEQFTYFIGYENEKSLSFDMPNSQLCFFDELIRNSNCHHIGSNMWESGGDYITDLKNGFPPQTPPIHPTHNPPYVVTIETNKNIQNNNWRDLIFKGLGYETMMRLCKWMNKEDNHSKDERQNFKGEFFGQLFYNKYLHKQTEMEEVFMQNFPSEAIALRDIKKRIGNKALAVEVQRLEAKLFHITIVSFLKQHYKNVPFSIKHDSITLPASEGKKISSKLNKIIQEFFKMDVCFKVDEL